MKARVIRQTLYGLLVGVCLIGLTGLASAHVVVKPAEVVTAGFQTFTMGVPNEKSVANVGLKLMIPAGLKHVSPTVKPGWNITVEKAGEGEEATVTSISWSGGSIASGYRDDFTFSAQVPAETGDLQWKAYQTYADSVIVSWDKSTEDQPKKADGSPDFTSSGPFSVTKVVSETQATTDLKATQQAAADANTAAKRAGYLAIAGLAIGVAAFVSSTKNSKKN